MYEKASSNSRCQGVSGEKAKPGELVRAAYKRINSPAICFTALRARPLAFCHSPLPIRCTVGDSPPMYLLTCSNVSVGTKTRSPGCPRFAGAYSITKYSRVMPPMVR
ncbi:unannotated protein [freshwater metagenome]|uniref:Unannotated protein n=1 Tax=freshwater metagenome TaxID=449393 RepID=A0A6J5YY70_9ZZZZ